MRLSFVSAIVFLLELIELDIVVKLGFEERVWLVLELICSYSIEFVDIDIERAKVGSVRKDGKNLISLSFLNGRIVN